MSELHQWSERRFRFDFPHDLYPNILARYRGTPARLEEAVHGVEHYSLIARPQGKWSMQENAGHLLDEEHLFAKRLAEYMSGSETLTPAPYLQRELTHNLVPIEQILHGFREARLKQVKQLEALRPDDFARSALHQRLNVYMRLVDHIYFVAEHDDHHLARIWQLRGGIRMFRCA